MKKRVLFSLILPLSYYNKGAPDVTHTWKLGDREVHHRIPSSMDHGSNMSNLDDGSRQTAGPHSRRCLFDLGLQQLYRQRYTIGSHQYWPYRTMYRTNPLPSYHSSSRRRPAVVFTKWIRRAFIPARFSRRSALSIVIGTFFALVILNQYHQQQKVI